MMDSNILQLRVFDWIRFPLIVCVVFLHGTPGYIVGPDFDEESVLSLQPNFEAVFVYTKILFQEVMTKFAVPSFFFISGYLFFYSVEEFTFGTYVYKIRRRIKSLLIPYLIWNTIAISYPLSLYFFRGIALPDNIGDWLLYYWDADDLYNLPLNYPLWFVRDLMVASVLSPLVYVLIKRGGGVFMLVLATLYLTKHLPSYTGLSKYVIFFFSFGAYLSIKRLNVISVFGKIEYVNYFVTLALLSSMMITYGRFPEIFSYLLPLYCISSLITVFNIAAHVFRNTRERVASVMDYLKERVFFIYATHTLVFIIMLDVVVKHTTYDAPIIFLFVLYLMMPFVKICGCIIAYNLMKFSMPKVLRVLNGGK